MEAPNGKLMRSDMLPRLSYRDLEDLQHVIELTDQVATGLRQNRNSTSELAVALLAEAQKPIMRICQRAAGVIARHCEKHGIPVDDASADEPASQAV